MKEEDRLGGASKGKGSNEEAPKAGFLMRGYSLVLGGFRRGAARAIQAQCFQLAAGQRDCRATRRLRRERGWVATRI